VVGVAVAVAGVKVAGDRVVGFDVIGFDVGFDVGYSEEEVDVAESVLRAATVIISRAAAILAGGFW